MADDIPRGTCTRCRRSYARRGMTRHLRSCRGKGPYLHLVVESEPDGLWWLHLALPPGATLWDIDAFLRSTWVECCGHLSQLDIDGVSYPSSAGAAWGPSGSMDAQAGHVLAPGASFTYVYDFGSPTQLRGRVVGTVAAEGTRPVLLARNEAIRWACESCGREATMICLHCKALSCEECGPDCHSCDEPIDEEHLPVVDSPRMGVCGYTG